MVGGLSFRAPAMPIVSNVTGEVVSRGCVLGGVLGAARA